MGQYRVRKLLRRFLNKGRNREIAPDEIFLDSSNLPEFDRNQFEGRIEKPIPKRSRIMVIGVFAIILLAFVGRIGFLQVYKGEAFAYLSENNRLEQSIIFAERGVLYDRNGKELAWNEPNPEEGSFALRRYIDRAGLAHVLGYVGYPLKDSRGIYYQSEYIGKGGVEEFLAARLGGKSGLKIEETDALQRTTSESVIRPPQDGENITLSVDAEVTAALHELIKARAEASGFSGGAGVMMDVRSGEIVALTSYPEYDPQVLTDGQPREQIVSYVEDQGKPFLNRIARGLYTPGSIVKPIVAIGALAEGVITPEKEILSTGSIRLPHPYIEGVYSTFVDWKAHGYVNMRRAIALSSNVYFYVIGGGFEGQKGIGIEGINKYARLFGLGSVTNSPFPELEGVIPNPEWKAQVFDGDEWRIGDTYNTAIGQYGFQATPMQMVRAIAAIANGGTLRTPVIEKGVSGEAYELGLDPDHLRVAREGMRLGVQEGTVQSLSIPYVSLAGKTGTAQLGTAKKFVNSWVQGFFPYENPRYAFVIIMERGPEENLVGAASVMRGFIEWMHLHAPEYLESVN